jgi:hypothetical protein
MKDTALDRGTAVMQHGTYLDYPKMCSLDGGTQLSHGYVCVEGSVGIVKYQSAKATVYKFFQI